VELAPRFLLERGAPKFYLSSVPRFLTTLFLSLPVLLQAETLPLLCSDFLATDYTLTLGGVEKVRLDAARVAPIGPKEFRRLWWQHRSERAHTRGGYVGAGRKLQILAERWFSPTPFFKSYPSVRAHLKHANFIRRALELPPLSVSYVDTLLGIAGVLREGEEIDLVGSYAHGVFDADSDIDVCLPCWNEYDNSEVHRCSLRYSHALKFLYRLGRDVQLLDRGHLEDPAALDRFRIRIEAGRIHFVVPSPETQSVETYSFSVM
jgi:predicted nucleotidyltransferase